jgi:hypothetical protein
VNLGNPPNNFSPSSLFYPGDSSRLNPAANQHHHRPISFIPTPADLKHPFHSFKNQYITEKPFASDSSFRLVCWWWSLWSLPLTFQFVPRNPFKHHTTAPTSRSSHPISLRDPTTSLASLFAGLHFTTQIQRTAPSTFAFSRSSFQLGLICAPTTSSQPGQSLNGLRVKRCAC